MTQYYFEVPNKSATKTQDQIFVGTEEQLNWLSGVLLNQGILETQPKILQVDERVNGLLEQYRGKNGDGGIRRKKLPYYSAYNENSNYGKDLRRIDENSITLLYVSLKDEVNWGQLIVRDVGGGRENLMIGLKIFLAYHSKLSFNSMGWQVVRLNQ